MMASDTLSELPDCADSPLRPGARTLAIMVTRRCNMTCDHCSVASGPGIKGEPTEAEVERWADDAIAAGIRSVLLTGGEPMLREELILRLLVKFKAADVVCAMTSNGFWGDTAQNAARRVRALERAGLCLLTISYDRFHADFMDFSPVRHIAKACAEEELDMNLNITRTAGDGELTAFSEEARSFPRMRLRFYDVQPVGRARHLQSENLRANLEGSCNACGIPVRTDDGRVMACNGPSFFQKPGSPLYCGSKGDPFADSLARHTDDPYLEGIRVLGPARLLRDFAKLPESAGFGIRENYAGMCEICLHLSGNPDAVQALRAHLASPPLQAELAAVRAVTCARNAELRKLEHLNKILAPRLLFQASFEPTVPLPARASQILGRADLDWSRLLRYLLACGLARPLLPLLEDPAVIQWAPAFFRDGLRRAGEAETVRLLVARGVMRRIGEILDQAGARAVLLKSPAVMLDADGHDHVPAPGDLDLFIPDGRAEEIHARLIETGFTLWHVNQPPRGPTPHHLPALNCNGIAVEIHHRVGHAALGLPEEAMLRDLQPLLGPIFRMQAEALFLHVVSHSAPHDFRLGLKTAWTANRILRTHADFDWNLLQTLARDYAASRGFWAVMPLLHRELEVSIPADFLKQAPRDRIQKRVNRLARLHFFSSLGDADEKEPFLTPLLVLLGQTRITGAAAALPYFLRLTAKEAWTRTQRSRRSISESATFTDLARREIRQYSRTYRNIIAG